jgi:hypothetical protein
MRLAQYADPWRVIRREWGEPGLDKPARVAVAVMSGQRVDPGRHLE